MKKLTVLLLQFAILLSCSKEYPSGIKEPEVHEEAPHILGYDFRQVSHEYEDHTDHIYYVNQTPGIQSAGGQHWVFTSPHLQGQEVGFAVISHPDCFFGDCDVILFLHGSNGTENTGSVNFYKNYYNQHRTKPFVFIMANGIGAEQGHHMGTLVWSERLNRSTLDTLRPLVVLKELIGGLIEDRQNQFGFITKDIARWTAFGFSAGAAGCMGIYAHREFLANSFQPSRIFPFGGWINPTSLDKYFDFTSGYERILNENLTSPELVIANHIQDDVDCEGYTTYERVVPFMRRMAAAAIHFTFLGATKTVDDPCVVRDDGSRSNRTHSSSFYLNQELADAELILSGTKPKNLELSTYYGEILFGPNE